jgi:hypothetical protein
VLHGVQQKVTASFEWRNTGIGMTMTYLKIQSQNFAEECPVTPSLLPPNILLSTLLSNTLTLWSSLNVRNQVSDRQDYVFYIIMFMFLDSEREDKKF